MRQPRAGAFCLEHCALLPRVHLGERALGVDARQRVENVSEKAPVLDRRCALLDLDAGARGVQTGPGRRR
ncbi:MAG: hypothetical protein ACK55Z_10700, partial [bacterium]